MRQPRDIWTVYGTVIEAGRPVWKQRITQEHTNDEDAWRAAITLRLESVECNLVLVHTTYRPHKQSKDHWRPVRTVIWRSGTGRAWFE